MDSFEKSEALRKRFLHAWQTQGRSILTDLLLEADPAHRDEAFFQLLDLEMDLRERQGGPLLKAEAWERFASLGPWAVSVLEEAFPEKSTVVLKVIEGPYWGKSFALEGATQFTIGRSTKLQISLSEDPYISRHHCLVMVNPQSVRIADLGSKSGTFVNAERIRVADLKHGDLIQVGSTVLEVVLPSDDPAISLDSPSNWTVEPAGLGALPSIPGFTIEREAGRGSMGAVYQAIWGETGETVALKTLHPALLASSPDVKRFLREVKILEKMEHPHIVRFVTAGTLKRYCYLAMEFVQGTDAKRWVAEKGPLPPAHALVWAEQLLDALQHAHERGIVHRDVKPSNLLVPFGGEREVIKVSDFGLAKAYESSSLSGLTMANQSGGTPAFMPPEQVDNFRGAGPKADQYAAAATIYHLLTGQNIYESALSVEELLDRILTHEPIPLRSSSPLVPDRFDAVIKRALQRSPENRFASVRAMKEALVGR